MSRSAREIWAKRVERWNASGLSAAEFARREKVRERTLKWWKWQLGSRAKKTAPISPLTFVEMAATTSHDGLELVLESGARVCVPTDFDAATLARLLDVLEHRR